jgi:hypothetical protein
MRTAVADTPLPSIEMDIHVRDFDPNPKSRQCVTGRVSSPSVNSMTPATTSSGSDNEDDVPYGATPAISESALPQARAQTHGLSTGLSRMHLSPEPEDALGSSRHQSERRRRSSSRLSRPRHDVRDEERPNSAFHDSDFQLALRNAKTLVSRIEESLASSDVHLDRDSTMHRLHEEAVKLAAFQWPSARRIGFVGDSGVGKSSLLNSLIDTKGLARTSGSGEACTCVVTEYHYHDKDTLDIVIESFTQEELHDQLQKLLRSYRHFHHTADEIDADDREDLKAQANLARDTFRAMFRGQMQDESMLLSGEEAKVLTTLCGWVKEAMQRHGPARYNNLITQECSDKLMELSSEPASKEQPANWPFIKNIK